MIFHFRKKQASLMAIALYFSFSSLSFAAPATPVIRKPEPPVGSVSREATVNSSATPNTTQNKIENKTRQPKAATTNTTTHSAVGGHAPTTSTATEKHAPVTTQRDTKSTSAKTAAKNTAAQEKDKNVVTPGHPFRIQDKKENYRSHLSKAATKRLDTTLANMIGGSEDKVPGLAVIVFKDGKEIYRNMMGNRFLSPRNPKWNLPVTADSRFRVASISKIFTAAGYLKLAEQGKIKLDEDVSRYLGFTLRNPHFPNKVITSRMLLSHTSSIRDYPTPYVPFKSSVKAFFSSSDCWTPATRAPGVYFSYSNLNYVLLGTIIEKVTGQRFDKYMTQAILKPLDIKGSFNLRDFSSSDIQKMGTIYRKTKGESGRYYAQIDDRPLELPDSGRLASYRPGTNAGLFSPQGGLRISPDELTHMLQMLMDKGKYKGTQILSPNTVRLMETQIWKYDPVSQNGNIEDSSIESYGMPLQLFRGDGETRPAPNRPGFHLLGHLGEAYGFIGGLMWQPETQNGFIFLQNGCASSGNINKGTYSLNYRWEENFMKAIIDNVFPYDNREYKSF